MINRSMSLLLDDLRADGIGDPLAACRREAGFPPRGTCYPRVS